MLITDFLKYVLPEATGCPAATARQAVLDSATEFLTYSGAWNELQDPIPLTALNNEYDLDAPTGARCIDVRAVYAPFFAGGHLQPATMEQIAIIFPQWATATSNLPSHYTRAFDFKTIKVFPIPDTPGGQVIRIHGVYTLKADATTIPDDIVERYREVISAGAKSRLMRMSSSQWKDLAMSNFYKTEFENGKLVAKVTAEHGKTRGYVSPPARAYGQ